MTRFIRFNIVGVLGFVVQLGALVLLERAGWPVILATIAAVEAAVLHNFVWHDRWTWADGRAGTLAGRLSRFQATNGAISLAGNGAITAALAAAGLHVVLANAIASIACAGANFASAHLLVWPRRPWWNSARPARGPLRGSQPVHVSLRAAATKPVPPSVC